MKNENIDYGDEMLDLWMLQKAKERELNGEGRKKGNGLFWFSVIMILVIIFLR